MNLEARKISLVQEFLRIDNEKLITSLDNLLHETRIEFFAENLKSKCIEDFNKEIDLALDDEKTIASFKHKI
ncbi:hypothetical protein IV494_00245 [Kaistella sp. G5-32]|uniref:Uncharacterized protein n=1 Tax=Kaistella gelatinilytica TaxID=2787636 RepID=A0ABS0F7E9_9FLAO|nr:hypothetical protein [Kaistella gelatinilytica]MBF8455597.1 hypothetical protein [Kaistella gelatinilytica]